jgi:hypothetical protein
MPWYELFPTLVLAIGPVIPVGRAFYWRFRDNEMKSYGVPNYGFAETFGFGVGALALGIIWPLTCLWLLIVAGPKKGDTELKQIARDRAENITRLEIELDREQRALNRQRQIRG